MNILQQTIGHITFKSPIVVAAGPLTDCIDKIKLAEDHGAGAVSTKLTMFSQEFPGIRKMYAQEGLYVFNPSDRRFDMDQGAVLVQQAKQDTDLPIFANMSGGGSIEEWITVGQVLEQAGADALELNFACPNLSRTQEKSIIPHGGQIAHSSEIACMIVQEMKKKVTIPIWVKFSGEGISVQNLIKALDGAGADGFCPFYALRGAPPIDIHHGGRPAVAAIDACSFGGMNGPCIAMPSNRIVAETAMSTKLPIMGGGGVSTMPDVIEKMMFGADLVFVCSEILIKGFQIIDLLNRQIQQYAEQYGLRNISDITRKALAYLIEPSKLSATHTRRPLVNRSRCIGCGKCENIASCTAITLEKGKAAITESQCEKCGFCASICPVKAIEFS